MTEVNNLTKKKVEEAYLKRVAKTVLGRKKMGLSIVLVGQARIKELNKEYRRENKATDVLSFFYGDSGEIVLCPAIINDNARRYKVNFEKELTRILIHGILHLLGYDHKRRGEKKLMAKKEEYYFSKIYGKR